MHVLLLAGALLRALLAGRLLLGLVAVLLLPGALLFKGALLMPPTLLPDGVLVVPPPDEGVDIPFDEAPPLNAALDVGVESTDDMPKGLDDPAALMKLNA